MGSSVRPRPRISSRVARYGERPLAFSPKSFPLRASHTIAKRSPPTPQDIGSTTPSTAFAVMAASTAFPPLRRTAIAACTASGWLVATIPCPEWTTERPTRPARRTWRGVPGGESADIEPPHRRQAPGPSTTGVLRPALYPGW